jgi:hypothetical protein
MRQGSVRYRGLTKRLAELRRHLLSFIPNPPTSKLLYSKQELDLTRAYTLLVHAEIEAFCEEIALGKAQAAKAAYDKTGKVRPALRRMIAYYIVRKHSSWSDVLNPAREIVEVSFQSYRRTIQDNHGVKRRNLEKLLFPLGLLETQLDGTWLAQMDSFGSDRGGFAHSSVRAQQPPDPLTQLSAVELLLQGLFELDRTLGQLR